MEKYNPEIEALLKTAYDDWGKPEENRENLIPYGIRAIDAALYGIDIVNGELIVFLGSEKTRKTTTVANIIVNIMTASIPVNKPLVIIESLESGMPPKRYRDVLLSIMASKILMSNGHKHHAVCPTCKANECRALNISPEFLKYKEKTQEQVNAIDLAIKTMSRWPILIFGPKPIEGDTRNFDASLRRLEQLTINRKSIVVSDHIQQYAVTGDDYNKQMAVISGFSNYVARTSNVAIVISQASLSSVKEARQGIGEINAAGGKKAHAEANVVFSCDYVSGSGKMSIDLIDSRRSETFSVTQTLEDTSGCFYGEGHRR